MAMSKPLTSFVLATCMQIWFAVSAGAEASRVGCTRESLHHYRTKTFGALVASNKFTAAIDGMETFLNQGDPDCWAALIGNLSEESSKEQKRAATEYLWARSDLALANLKADKPGACLEIVKVEQGQYYQNPLEIVESEQLDQAFSTNEQVCEARRAEIFPKVSTTACKLPTLPSTILLSDFSESRDAAQPFPIRGVKQSFVVAGQTGFKCLAAVEIGIPKGLAEGKCSNVKECLSTGEPEDAVEERIVELFGITEGADPRFVKLDTIEDGWCGDPELSLHKDSRNGKDALEDVLRVSAGLAACGGGTARAEIDSYFKIKGGKLLELDSSNPGYH